MAPIRLNRRKFMGVSAAASWAVFANPSAGEVPPIEEPVRVGLVGLGTRGTSLIRTLCECPEARLVAVADPEPKHRRRASGITQKATNQAPEEFETLEALLGSEKVEAVLIAAPNDLHAAMAAFALESGRPVLVEKPLGLTLDECDQIAAMAESTGLPVHVGFQRASNPRVLACWDRIAEGGLGRPIEGRASWISSNGPLDGQGGWLASAERSGDWMIEQGVHIWQIYNRLLGGPPESVTGYGCRDLFADSQPDRDVHDLYSAQLLWPCGFGLSVRQSWVDPPSSRNTGVSMQVIGRDAALDFQTGLLVPNDRRRDQEELHPGPQPDTKQMLLAFLHTVRHSDAVNPPVSLAEARDATLTGLMVREAVQSRGVVMRSTIEHVST